MSLFKGFYGAFLLANLFNVCSGYAQHMQNGNQAMKRTISGLDTFVVNQYKLRKFSGVVLIAHLYASKGDSLPIFLKYYGFADHEKGIPILPDTKFITTSVAKTFTATAVLQLVQAGKIDLNRRLSFYLPDSIYPRSVSDHITIIQLLTHTAGLGDVITGKTFRSRPYDFKNLSQLVKLVREEQQSSRIC